MKMLLLVCLCMCGFANIKAQDFNDYTYVDSKALLLPKSSSYTTTGIAGYVQTNFKTEKEKIRAVYTWITANIHYSKDSMFYRYWGDDPERKLSSVLMARKGVCEDYATLLTNILLKCGIPSFVVTGYTKISGNINPAGHSWCAVYENQEWMLCDPTWDEGFNGPARYFLLSPSQFIETHFSFDPLWQLLEHPISQKEFLQGFARSKREEVGFNYKDSVTAFLQLDTLQQQEAASRRMMQAGLDNEMIQIWYAYNQMKIAIVHQESDMLVFNSAVADLNKAKFIYNDFVAYRNNKFIPVRADETVKKNFNSIDSLLMTASQKITNIGKEAENFQYDSDGLKTNLDILTAKVQMQKDFLEKYFLASTVEREKLLYQ